VRQLKAFGLGMLAALVVVLATLLGGWLVLSATTRDPYAHAHWLPVQASGAHVAAFVGWRADLGMVMRTDTGAMLACQPPAACTTTMWTTANQPGEVLDPPPKEPPAGVVETVAIHHAGVCLHEELFARTRDGAVWSMSVEPTNCEVGGMIPLFFALIGAGVGFFLSVGSLLVSWRRIAALAD
jgi:hypothetical protein